MNRSIIGHLCAILAIVVWPLSSYSYSRLGEYLSPLEILVAGTLTSVAVLNLIYIPRLHLRKKRLEAGFILAGLFGVALWYYLSGRTAASLPSGCFSVVYALVPICCLFVGKISGRHPFVSRSFFAGFGFSLVGILVLVYADGGALPSLLGVAFALASALTLGAFFVSYKSPLHTGNVIAVCRRVLLWGFVFLIPLCFFGNFDIESYRAVLSVDMLLHLVITCVALPSVSCLAIGYAIKTLDPTRASGYVYAVPIAAILYRAILHSRSVSSFVLVSVILIIIGITLSVKRK